MSAGMGASPASTASATTTRRARTSDPQFAAEERQRAAPRVGCRGRVVDFGTRVVEKGVGGAGGGVKFVAFAEPRQFLVERLDDRGGHECVLAGVNAEN